MASLFQYQKLKPEPGLDDVGELNTVFGPHYGIRSIPRPGILHRSSASRVWSRVRRRVPVRRRLRVRVPGLRRFLRRKARLVSAAVRKVVRRLKESQEHLGDLFAGNYLFLQVNPSNPATKKLAAVARYNNNPSSRFPAVAYNAPRPVV